MSQQSGRCQGGGGAVMDVLSDSEIAEREAEMERAELADVGYYAAEPEEAPLTRA